MKQVILITGSSSGMGELAAKALAGAGAHRLCKHAGVDREQCGEIRQFSPFFERASFGTHSLATREYVGEWIHGDLDDDEGSKDSKAWFKFRRSLN